MGGAPKTPSILVLASLRKDVKGLTETKLDITDKVVVMLKEEVVKHVVDLKRL